MRLGILACSAIALAVLAPTAALGKQTSRGMDDAGVRIAAGERGFIELQENTDSRIASLGAGAPPSLSLFGTWLTSDYEADILSTNNYWCDFEITTLIALIYTQSPQAVVVTVKVYGARGALVYSDTKLGSPFVDSISIFASEVGILESGVYRIVFKTKQGRKSVGSQFWIAVYPGSNPLCQVTPEDTVGR